MCYNTDVVKLQWFGEEDIMAQMVISVAELTNKKGVLEELAATFKAKLDDFKETGDRLHSMWEGDAKDGFMKNFDLDFQKMTQLFKLLIDFISVLQKIINLYKMMEMKNTQIANS